MDGLKIAPILDKVKEVFSKINKKRLVVVLVAAIVLVNIVLGFVVNGYVFRKDGIKGTKWEKELVHIELSEKKYDAWFEKKASSEKIKGEDNHTLEAVRLDNYDTSHSYVIICHPYSKEPADMARYAYHFYDLGFNVYLPYGRGHGKSDYKKTALGYGDDADLLLWINHVTSKDKDAKIFVFGLGMGGTSSLLTANVVENDAVRGIIADCPYSDFKEIVRYNVKEIGGINPFICVDIAFLINGVSYKEADVKKAVEKSNVPILYIQGGEDQVVPAEQINDLYDITSAQNSDHVLISGATHNETLDFSEEKYWNNVDAFILNCLS